MKYCVLLPAYNEEKAIAQLIRDIKSQGLDVIVVDDGSKDDTAKITEQERAVVLKHPQNLGKGQALRTGFDYIKNSSCDGVIIMDADGQHCPKEIKNFIQQAQNSTAAIIIGNRMHRPEGMPFLRWLTNILTSHFISCLVGYKIPDSQCGFRLMKTEVLKKINLSTIKYDTESEILIEAARHHFQIDSIPIRTIYANQKSQIHPVVDTVRFISLIARNIWQKK